MKPFWKKKDEINFEEKLKYKIRADPKDHSFTISLSANIKKGMMLDLYTKMSKKFPGEKKDFGELEADTFSLPEKYVGILHTRLRKTYGEIETETKKDFLKEGKKFRITILKTLSCDFTKQNQDEYSVVVKTEGYWSGS